MFLGTLVRLVFVGVLLISAGSAYARHPACCACGQCVAGCTCGCGCGDVNGKMACLKSVDAANDLATFTEETPDGKEFKLPLLDLDVLEKIKPGDCGLVKVQNQVVCTGFKKQEQKQ